MITAWIVNGGVRGTQQALFRLAAGSRPKCLAVPVGQRAQAHAAPGTWNEMTSGVAVTCRCGSSISSR